MKKILTLLVLIISILTLNLNVKAQTKLAECEYSNEFKEWLTLSNEDKQNTKMPAICKFYYDSVNINFKGASHNDSSYSLVAEGYVTSVKDQLETGTCWAHATTASIESNLLKNGLGNNNLSSGHIELATQNSLYTPTRTTFDRDFNSGGSSRFLTAPYVLNYWGPIAEVSKYSTNILMDIITQKSSITANIIETEKAKYDVNDIAFLLNDSCDTNAKNEIKRYLVNHGAITASIYWAAFSENFTVDAENLTLKDKFVNGEYYYYSGEAYNILDGGAEAANAEANHEVVIVGWDDTISRNNFATKPSTDGAWLVKNSYGQNITDELGNPVLKMGNEGYFWVSYEDINICTDLAGFYNVDETLSDNLYYYDDLGAPFALKALTNQIYLSNTFENNSGKIESIDKITFAVSQVGLNYTVYYAPNGSISNYQNNVIAQGITDHLGYMSVQINNKKINTDKFSIIIKLSDSNNKELYFPISLKLPDTIFSNTPLKSNVSFISADGSAWQDTNAQSEIQFMNSIRVYTTSENEPLTKPPTEEEKEVNTNNDIEVELNDNTVVQNNSDNLSNPQTGVQNINLSLVGILFALITGYSILRRINIFGKI